MRDWIKLFEDQNQPAAANDAEVSDDNANQYAMETKVEAYILNACKALNMSFFDNQNPVVFDATDKTLTVSPDDETITLTMLENFKTLGTVAVGYSYGSSQGGLKIEVTDVNTDYLYGRAGVQAPNANTAPAPATNNAQPQTTAAVPPTNTPQQ